MLKDASKLPGKHKVVLDCQIVIIAIQEMLGQWRTARGESDRYDLVRMDSTWLWETGQEI